MLLGPESRLRETLLKWNITGSLTQAIQLDDFDTATLLNGNSGVEE